MSVIFSNNRGVQAGAAIIGALNADIAQLAVIDAAQSDAHKSGVDGDIRIPAHAFNDIAKQTLDWSCATAQNLRTFMENASHTTVTLDHAHSVSISQLQTGGVR